MRIVEYGPWQLHEPGTDVQALYRAVMVSPTIHICEALLRGEAVPIGRLDQTWLRKLGRR